jgi:replicative DNA helicase
VTDWLDRQQPRNDDAERALLGQILAEPNTLAEVADVVTADDFYRPEHGALYRLLTDMYAQQQPIDLVLVADRIAQAGQAQAYGGLGYVCELPDRVVSTTNARHHAVAVAETALQRQVIAAALDLADAAFTRRAPADELVSEYTERLSRMGSRQKRHDWRLSEAIDAAWAELEERRKAGRPLAYGTEIPGLDRLLGGGLRPGELVIVAGRPSMGKTGFAIGALLECAFKGNQAGLISIEQGKSEIAMRVLSQVTGVPHDVIRGGALDEEDQARLDDAGNLPALGLRISDMVGPTMGDILRQARRWKAAGGLDMLAIDYLGLIKHERHDKPHVAIGQTVKQCKGLARYLQCPVVLLVQLNRESLKRTPVGGGPEWWRQIPLPALNDLADSGDIERDADVVLFPIASDVIRQQGAHALQAYPGDAVVVVAKNRNGQTGIAPARWRGSTASYHAPTGHLFAVGGDQ